MDEHDKESLMEIVNINKLADFSRKLVFFNFGSKETSSLDVNVFIEQVKNIDSEAAEINDVLPMKETKNIFKQFLIRKRHKKTKQIAYFMKESDYDEVLVQLNSRMVSNIVQSLVKKGVLNTAFDDEKNDFIFWVNKLGE